MDLVGEAPVAHVLSNRTEEVIVHVDPDEVGNIPVIGVVDDVGLLEEQLLVLGVPLPLPLVLLDEHLLVAVVPFVPSAVGFLGYGGLLLEPAPVHGDLGAVGP